MTLKMEGAGSSGNIGEENSNVNVMMKVAMTMATDGRIVNWNESAENLIPGPPAEKSSGKDDDDINNDDGERKTGQNDKRLGDFLRQLKCSGYKKIPESCGLSFGELEAMAARQARQLETQEQLLAAKAQRLRFLKSGGEVERLQRLREKVAMQEERLRKLRGLRGKVHSNRGANASLSSDLESLRAVFNEKEKELSVAVAKVDELTQQLDELRQGNKETSTSQSAAALELEKLRRELMYRQKLREAQATRVAAQRVALSQRKDETMRIDRRIAELQERLHRKRLLNHQLAATLKHQDNNADDFVSVAPPTKNDPKYQTLPYNAKLFAPFSNHHHHQQSKHERDQYESSMQQKMQIMQLDSHDDQQQQQNHHHHHQQQQQQHKSNQLRNYNNNLNNNVQLQQVLSQNQHNAKSGTLLGQISAPNLTYHHQQQQQQQQGSSPVPTITSSSSSHDTHSNGGVPSWASSNNNNKNMLTSHENFYPAIVVGARPSNFGPTGAPAPPPLPPANVHSSSVPLHSTATTTSASIITTTTTSTTPSSINSGLPQGGNEVSSAATVSVSGSSVSDTTWTGTAATSGAGNGGSSLNIISAAAVASRLAASKPALPPKPAKPTPPPRSQGVHDIYNNYQQQQRSGTNEREGGTIVSDRTELPIKPKPLFIKKSGSSSIQHAPNSSISSPMTSSALSGAVGTSASLERDGNSFGPTVRVSISRKIEMPPAFLFPESDPPPSDLLPENQSGSGTQQQQQQQHQLQQLQQELKGSAATESSTGSKDETDASALEKPPPLPPLPEEYTLPDLFPQSHTTALLHNNKMNNNIADGLSKDYNDAYFAHLSEQQNQASMLSAVAAVTTAANINNAYRIANMNNLSPRSKNTAAGEETTQRLDEQENNHVSVMSIQVGQTSPSNVETKMDLSPIHLESYEIRNETLGVDSSGDRDDVASDSANSGSTITTTTSSVSSGGNGGVLRRVKKTNLKSSNKDHVPLGRRVSFDPLALLLDASLEGELELVVKTASEVGNASAANDEGITALHNAICAGHAEVVRFLVEFGCDVNAQDSDGWTPLHCAASCNNVGMVKFLVERGACIFATTLSDHETAAEKCEEDEDGFGPCSEYLYSIQEKLGIMNTGIVYAVFDYDAQNPDELSFREGDRLVILRKGDEYEREWWWAQLGEKQGYVPRNLLGLYPRVVPQKHGRNSES